jgi:hypothetical protein
MIAKIMNLWKVWTRSALILIKMVTLISFLNLSAVFVTVPKAVLVITVLPGAKVSMVGQWRKMHTSGFGCDPRSHPLLFGQSAQSSRLQTKMVIEKHTSSIMHLVLCRRWGWCSLPNHTTIKFELVCMSILRQWDSLPNE